MTDPAPENDQTGRRDASARLELARLHRSFGEIKAVTDVSVSVAAGEIHALCGHNGAGKSTVVKMICGLLRPDAGHIFIDGRQMEMHSTHDAQLAGIAIVDQELSVIPSLTVAENLMLGAVDEPLLLHRRAINRHARELLDRIGLTVNPDTTLGHLSIGERQLVEIARALGRGAQILLLDEPTATLSGAEIELVFAAVRAAAAEGCAVIFVSHRLGEVIDLCDRVTVMRDGRTVVTTSTLGLHPNEIVRHMLGELPPPIKKVTLDTRPPELVIRNLTTPGLFAPVSLDICPGRIYALAGQVGSGASDVLRALAGLYPSASGSVSIADQPLALGRPTLARRRGIAFVSSDRKSEGLFLTKDVRVNLLANRLKSVSRFGVLLRRKMGSVSAAVASAAGVAESRLDTAVQQLSGGNQQKVLVGRNLADSNVKVLLLDEPTRGVDVGGRGAIHQLLRDTAARGVAVIFASTELDELVQLADTVITMRNGAIVTSYEGDATETAVLNDITHASAGVA
jgi:ABC-type sugar transport system ATPase subunit